jgi:polysaccharide pyruvyl transferase WcaK-like protein
VLFPRYLEQLVPQFDGVIACEGSTFKSTFTDLLSTMMVGALGLASAAGKLSVAYGAEVGEMTPRLTDMVTEYCRDSYLICRNQASRERLARIGLAAESGTDTAWTFEPLPRAYGEWELRKQGWRGEPVLVLCAINPFWWPVQASFGKTLARGLGFYRHSHYGRIFFHQSGPEVEARFARYLESIATSVREFCRMRGYFPVVAASERLDRHAMTRLSALLGGTPTFRSDEYDTCQFVSILRCANLMLSSRFHAIVTSMPGGVVSAGISMDERINNLMHDRGHERLCLSVRDDDLTGRLLAALETMHEEADVLRPQILQTVARHLRQMAAMGRQFLQHVTARHSELASPRVQRSWEDYLPPIGRELEVILERHSSESAHAA